MQPFWHPLAKHEPSPNFWTNRLGHDMSQPSWVVVHTMVCCEPAAYARFRQPSQQASSTYGVKLDGSFVQYVDEKDGPWTDGTSEGVGSNLDVITIEHEDCGDYNGPRTPELYRTSGLLVREICQRYGIPIDRQHIIGHRECSGASTACPDSLDVDRIVALAATGEDDVDPTLAAKLDQLANVMLGGGDNRVPNPAIYASLAAIRGDDSGLLAAVQASQQELRAAKAELDALKAGPAIDVSALAAALAAHLPPAVDVHALALELEAVLPGADAEAIKAALAKALGGG